MEENLRVGSPYKSKVWTFPFCWISPPQKLNTLSPDNTPDIKKKVTIITFRQILPKILSEACISSNTIVKYLKKFVWIKSLSTKQCSAGLSPLIIPHYPLNIYGNPWNGRDPTAKNLFISSNRKIPLNKFTSFPISKVLSPPWNSNFHLITLYKLHLWM